jgi:hypothetical protein
MERVCERCHKKLSLLFEAISFAKIKDGEGAPTARSAIGRKGPKNVDYGRRFARNS